MAKLQCYKCGEWFTPSPVQLMLWEESSSDFDPTDWECGACIADANDPPPPDDPGWLPRSMTEDLS